MYVAGYRQQHFEEAWVSRYVFGIVDCVPARDAEHHNSLATVGTR